MRQHVSLPPLSTACMMEGRADQFVGKKPPLLLSCRALVSILIFFGYTNMYLQRVGLSVAIVCMVNHTALRVLASGDNSSAVKFSDCSIHWNTSQDMEVRRSLVPSPKRKQQLCNNVELN